mgnify:CR=1 FL=1
MAEVNGIELPTLIQRCTMSGKDTAKRERGWPQRPGTFPDLMTPVEAAMFLRLDETGHNPASASRTLNYWRNTGELRATKYARRVWYLRDELNAFLERKTEE